MPTTPGQGFILVKTKKDKETTTIFELKNETSKITITPTTEEFIPLLKTIAKKMRSYVEARHTTRSSTTAAGGAGSDTTETSNFARDLNDSIDYLFSGAEIEKCKYKTIDGGIKTIKFPLSEDIDNPLSVIVSKNSAGENSITFIDTIHRQPITLEFFTSDEGAMKFKDREGNVFEENHQYLKLFAEKIKELEEEVATANIKTKSTSRAYSSSEYSKAKKDDSFAQDLYKKFTDLFSGANPKSDKYTFVDTVDPALVCLMQMVQVRLGIILLLVLRL
jgi:hypothetical protein